MTTINETRFSPQAPTSVIFALRFFTATAQNTSQAPRSRTITSIVMPSHRQQAIIPTSNTRKTLLARIPRT